MTPPGVTTTERAPHARSDPALLEQDVAEALRLLVVAPQRSRALALEAHREASAQRRWTTAGRAARVAGVASLHLRDLAGSVSALRESIRAARRAGSTEVEAEARMSLAATLMVGGSPRKAVAEIDSALGALDGVPAARARVQRATIYQSIGRFEEALAEFRVAIPVLRRAGDVEWHSRALNNRSVLLTSRRAFGAAEADLVAAELLCRRSGLDLQATYARQNLGALKAAQGEVVTALECFDDAAREYRRLGVHVPSLLIDRGELLLSVRLVAEAQASARDAVAVLREQRFRAELPSALLLQSTAELLAGDAPAALAAAADAGREFSRLGRHQGLTLARWSALQARLEVDPRAVGAARARRCAVELEAAGWTVPALEARVLAGRLAMTRGRLADARRDLGLASAARHAGPADARARAWLAEALLRAAAGQRQSARRALRAGLRIVEDYQATLGATELRAHVSAHRGSLARFGVRLALEDRSARQVLVWAERARVSGLQIRPPRPPGDGMLAATLADLRTTMRELEERLVAGRPAADLQQRQMRLEREVAAWQRRLPPSDRSATVRPPPFAELAAALGDRALVEFVELDGELHAVVVVRGRATLFDVGPVVQLRERLNQVTFALQRLSHPRSARSIEANRAVLATVGGEFDAQLLRPLAALIADRELVVVPTGPLQSLPWSLLSSCADRPVSVVPSATAWLAASRRPDPAPDAAIVSVAGPGLAGAQVEAAAVAELYPGATLLTGPEATVQALAATSGAAVVHVAAHGELRADNPLFSSLRMADGPLTVYDLDRLAQPAHHVVLAACNSARGHVIGQPAAPTSDGLTGDEVLGFAAALLVQGTRSLVASVIPVPDASTVALMTAYHRELRAGASPAAALAAARRRSLEDGPAAQATAAAFVCLGAG